VDELIQKYEAEIARINELDADLDKLWVRVPYYGLLALLAPVAWYLYGFGWAVATLLVTASLMGTQAYLIGVRKSENRWNRSRLEEDLARRRAELEAEGRDA
jgi:hypothetical protein